MINDSNRRLALLISANESDPYNGRFYLHITAELVRLTEKDETGGPSTVLGIRNLTNDEQFGGCLVARAQADGQTLARPDPLYGWDVTYQNPYTVTLPIAEKMVATLRRVEKKLERAKATDGYPESYGEYLLRVGRALGVGLAVWKVSGNGHMFSQNEYRVEPLSAVRARVNHLLWEARNKHAEKSEVGA